MRETEQVATGNTVRQANYTPIDGGSPEQARVPAVSGAGHFLTGSICRKAGEAEYKVEVISYKHSFHLHSQEKVDTPGSVL